jgi:hypothetical protein
MPTVTIWQYKLVSDNNTELKRLSFLFLHSRNDVYQAQYLQDVYQVQWIAMITIVHSRSTQAASHSSDIQKFSSISPDPYRTVLCYKSEGRWFDSRPRNWKLSFT